MEGDEPPSHMVGEEFSPTNHTAGGGGGATNEPRSDPPCNSLSGSKRRTEERCEKREIFSSPCCFQVYPSCHNATKFPAHPRGHGSLLVFFPWAGGSFAQAGRAVIADLSWTTVSLSIQQLRYVRSRSRTPEEQAEDFLACALLAFSCHSLAGCIMAARHQKEKRADDTDSFLQSRTQAYIVNLK